MEPSFSSSFGPACVWIKEAQTSVITHIMLQQLSSQQIKQNNFIIASSTFDIIVNQIIMQALANWCASHIILV